MIKNNKEMKQTPIISTEYYKGDILIIISDCISSFL